MTIKEIREHVKTMRESGYQPLWHNADIVTDMIECLASEVDKLQKNQDPTIYNNKAAASEPIRERTAGEVAAERFVHISNSESHPGKCVTVYLPHAINKGVAIQITNPAADGAESVAKRMKRIVACIIDAERKAERAACADLVMEHHGGSAAHVAIINRK